MTTIVGLTGNIASGKSTVASMFARRGASVIDADVLARDAVAPGTRAIETIRERWPSVVDSKGLLNRSALRQIVFADDVERRALNAIVHPEVGRLRDEAISQAERQKVPLVIYDVPLLFEENLQSTVDAIVLVDAPEDLRLKRLVRSRGLTEGEARQMIAAQMPASEKRPRAHYIIDNDGDLDLLQTRADTVWRALAPASARG